jgi:hypothetical protein
MRWGSHTPPRKLDSSHDVIDPGGALHRPPHLKPVPPAKVQGKTFNFSATGNNEFVQVPSFPVNPGYTVSVRPQPTPFLGQAVNAGVVVVGRSIAELRAAITASAGAALNTVLVLLPTDQQQQIPITALANTNRLFLFFKFAGDGVTFYIEPPA